MRKRLRRLQSEAAHADIFAMYEAEIASATEEAAAQRAAAAELECLVRDLRLQLETREAAAAGGGGGGGSPGPASPRASPVLPRAASGAVVSGVVAEGKAARVRSWKRALAQADKESAGLRIALADAQRRLRQSDLHKRTADNSSRKLLKASRELERLGAELRDLTLTHSRVLAELAAERARRGQLQLTFEEEVRKSEAVAEELALSKAAHQQLAYERRREAAFLRGPRMAGASGTTPPRSRPQSRRGRGSAAESLTAVEAELRAAGIRLPRVTVLLRAAAKEADAADAARREAAQREEELMQMLVAQQMAAAMAAQVGTTGGGAGADMAAGRAAGAIVL